MDRKSLVPLIGEAFGTFLFVFVGMASIVLGSVLTGGTTLVAVALAHGITLAVVVTAFAAISGGHINPAVTVGLWINRSIGTVQAVSYIVAQLVGAGLAGFFAKSIYPAASVAASGLGKPALGAGVDPVSGAVLEVVMTMVLVTAVFFTAVDPRAPKLGGLLIGFSIIGDILIGGPLTGAAMNPARWFGPAIAQMDFSDAWVWIVGPVVGAAVVAALYRWVFSPAANAEAAA